MNLKLALFTFVILNVCHFLDAQQLDFNNDCKCHLPKVDPEKSGDVSYPTPWVVSLTTKYNGDHVCGGTIINHNWIVTSAQCVANIDSEKKLKLLQVRTGVQKLNDFNKYPNKYNVVQIIMDKRFNKNNKPTQEGDIAFLEIDGSIEFNREVGPACFPKNNTYERFYGKRYEETLRTFGFEAFSKNRDIDRYYSTGRGTEKLAPFSTGGGFYENMKETYLEDVSGDCKKHFICGINRTYRDKVCGGDLGMPLSYDKDGRTKVVGFAAFSFLQRSKYGERLYCRGNHAFVRLSEYIQHFDKIAPNNYCTL